MQFFYIRKFSRPYSDKLARNKISYNFGFTLLSVYEANIVSIVRDTNAQIT